MSEPQTDSAEEVRDVEVITTHMGADYDALASMLAASKLYPGAMLVLPGAQERNLRNFFVESTSYYFNFKKIKEVPYKRVKRLIVVDTRQLERIGPLAPLALDPEVEVHAYDHHPDTDNDVKAHKQVVRHTGSTMSILAPLMREKGVKLTADEATLMSLGIHEDTGSFTFVSTTPADHEAAAWLLSQGANLSILADLITRELTAEQVGLLNDMIDTAVTLNIEGVEVVITEVSSENYVGDFAVLVHKFMDIENLNVMVALARMEARVYLVARSRLPQVDVGRLASAFGGGGHASAASASMKDLTLVEARAQVERVLRDQISPSRSAGDLMSSPAKFIKAETSISEAALALTRYNINVLPVTDDGQVLGLITRQLVDKAVYHDLGELPVADYMVSPVQSVGPKAPLSEVEDKLVRQRQRLLPVVQNGRLVGVVTRTDLLTSIMERPLVPDYLYGPGRSRQSERGKSMRSLMQERLPKQVQEILIRLGQVATGIGMNLFLVGGGVRDLFLRRDNLDLDLVVEGGGIAFAEEAAATLGGIRVRAHRKFNTAKLIFDDGLVIDVATARLEYYQSPAALPEVELSSLKLDLYRRDFTINTLAIRLNPEDYGQLIDFFDALKDLKGRWIRVLHNLSFVEDPTRVFRAVRFEQRFGFKIGKFTEGLIKNALKIDVFRRLSGARLFNEFKLMMNEERAGDCLRRLEELGLLPVFHPKLKLGPKTLELLERVENTLAFYRLSFLERPLRQWIVLLLVMAEDLDDAELGALCARFFTSPSQAAELVRERGQARQVINRLQRSGLKNSQAHALLKPLKTAYQLFIMAGTNREETARMVSHHLTVGERERTQLRGEDLKKMGFTPGPLFSDILGRVLAARLDGEVVTKNQEMELVEREFGELKGKSPF